MSIFSQTIVFEPSFYTCQDNNSTPIVSCKLITLLLDRVGIKTPAYECVCCDFRSCNDECPRYQSFDEHFKGNLIIFCCYCFFKVAKREKKNEIKKYAVKPPKDLQSKFEAKMAAKKEAQENEKEQKRIEEEIARKKVTGLH